MKITSPHGLSWLTPAEYADTFNPRRDLALRSGQLGLMLPLLARLRLPMPLGGTSNHSRAAALREVNYITALVRDLAGSTHLEAAE